MMLKKSQRGMTLVEVLVAMVIMSIGMLGIAALYVETTRANRTALIRSQAIGFVNDMADRIRANPRGQLAYDIDTYGGAPALRGCVAGGANCTEAALAEDDLSRWITTVQAGLPNVNLNDVQLVQVAGFPDQYTIRVQWTEPSADPLLPDTYDYRSNIEVTPVAP